MSKFWDLRQAAAAKTLDLYIYTDVEGDSFDYYTGQVIESETSAKAFREKLEAAGAVDKINMYINSLGGSVVEGTAIYNQLKRHPAQKTAYADGFICSIASVIAMAADTIVMPRNTAMFVHNMMNIVMGNATQLRKAADDLDTLMAANRQAYLQKAGDKLTEARLIELLEAETWLTAEQCIELGLADEFAANEADLSQAKQMLEAATQKTMKQQYDRLVAKAQQPPQQAQTPAAPPAPQQKTNADRLRAAFKK